MEQHNLEALTEAIAERLFVPLEASGRHVHITRDQAQTLFGHGLTPKRALSQPGQYLSNERVTVVGPKGRFENVAVLGPERKEAQVELSLTDARALGLEIPIRMSGDVVRSPGAVLEGDRGMVELTQGVIAAQRHIHFSPEEAARHGVKDGQKVRLDTLTDRPVTFQDVVVRVHPSFSAAVHLDYDEANACGFSAGDLGRIRL